MDKTATKKKVQIHFGALSLPIVDQLLEQGVSVIPGDINHFQTDANAITRLVLRGLISEAQARTARGKLIKKIAKGCK